MRFFTHLMRLFLFVWPLTACVAFCDEIEVELEPIVIRGGGYSFDKEFPAKAGATVILKETPGATLEDALDYSAGLDMSQRGIGH